ncbi:hypothetical protein [Ottowia sp. VDI28]|uniref:hypothetical protein n=1 Tax=Ottowia sp. VDI28 TaxID=3133968 RepID=UPI003C2D6F14
MEIRLIGGRAEGQSMTVPDDATHHAVTHEDGTVEMYTTHHSFEFSDSRSGRGVSKFAYFALRSMSFDETLARAHELFDDPEEDLPH